MKINETGDIEILPSTKSAASDFDFFHGKWKFRNRKLKERLKNSDEWIEFEADQECIKILDGFGNTDLVQAQIDGEKFEAITLRLFNPKTRLWSIYWADSKAVVLDVPQVGSWDGNIGEFYARYVWEGTPVIVKFHWDKTDPNEPVWSQAFSADNGQTWEWNWYMYFTKAI
jgi:hypothetical protein